MKITGHGESNVGRQRDNNEDSFLVDDALGLYIVCDGMGGHQGGEVASRMAAEIAAREIAARRDLLSGKAATQEVTQLVAEAIRTANREIHQRAAKEPHLKGMGCAMTLLLASEAAGFVGHVGDTRLYLLRDGAVEQLSQDHTMVSELVRSGVVSPEEQDRVPHAHVLTRAVGSQENVDVEVSVISLQADDRFLLCSDGLSGYVKDGAVLEEHLSADDPATVPGTLVQFANEAGGRDNVTAVVLSVDADG